MPLKKTLGPASMTYEKSILFIFKFNKKILYLFG